MRWRPLGQGQFRLLPESSIATIGRGAVQIQFPVIDETFEYYIEAEAERGVRLSWPVTAPGINQTVLVW